MSGINVQKWVISSVVAAVIMWVFEGASSFLYMDEMTAALEAHNITVSMGGSMIALSVLISLVAGFALMFIYVGIRPRFGAGPRTAVIAGVTLWFGGYLLSILGYSMLGMYGAGMLTLWAIIGLVELVVAALVGAKLYKE